MADKPKGRDELGGSIIRDAVPKFFEEHHYTAADFIPVPADDIAGLVQTIEEGLPISALERFQKRCDLSTQQIAKLLRVPLRTLARRRVEGRLSAEESDRLVRVSRLVANATNLFGGNVRAGVDWLSKPLLALGGATPFNVAVSETGSHEVERVIHQLEHGVFP